VLCRTGSIFSSFTGRARGRPPGRGDPGGRPHGL